MQIVIEIPADFYKRIQDDVYDVYDPVDALKAVRKGMLLQDIDRWIPVEEKLPEQHGVYLVTLNDMDTDFCEFYPVQQMFGMRGIRCDEVTAWMPLPAPYGGKEGKE